jgi:hypothetical protein
MNRTAFRGRPAAIVSLFLVLAVVPAGGAKAGHGLFQHPTNTGDVVASPAQPQARPYVVYRPAYPIPGTKPLYLSNYAGANYPSRAPGAALTPAEFRMRTGRPSRPRWGWLGAGW